MKVYIASLDVHIPATSKEAADVALYDTLTDGPMTIIDHRGEPYYAYFVNVPEGTVREAGYDEADVVTVVTVREHCKVDTDEDLRDQTVAIHYTTPRRLLRGETRQCIWGVITHVDDKCIKISVATDMPVRNIPKLWIDSIVTLNACRQTNLRP